MHHGHLIIASHMANFTDLDAVWFVVSPQNPFKETQSLLNENHRKHLVDLAIAGDHRLKSSNIEFKLPRPSYTIDTLVHLEEKYPGHQFSIIMGSDGFKNIEKWKSAAVILKNYQILIYKRAGFDVDPARLANNIKIVDAPILQISGSFIRQLIKERKSIRYLVPDIVNEQIQSQQYFF